MTNGDVVSVRIPITLDYLAPADTSVTFVNIGGTLGTAEFPSVDANLVDVSGNNNIRKTVVVIVGDNAAFP